MGNWEKVIACLKELDIKPKLTSFQSKLIVQKTVYLLASMGMKMEYPFNFYVRGTYSPKLTDDLYEHQKEFEALSGGEKLSEKEHEILEEYKREMGQTPDPAVLEIAAAYAFFFKQCGNDAKVATLKTKDAKPFFSETQFVQGINRAKALVYKPTQEELKKMKDEFKRWEGA